LWKQGADTEGVQLRTTTRKKLLVADFDTAAAMSGMLPLAHISHGGQKVDDRDQILAAVPDKIADWIVILNGWRLAKTQPKRCDKQIVRVPRKDKDRSEPCPFDPGKK